MKDTTSFEFHAKGNKTGEVYKGTFVIKTAMTARDILRADAFRRKALGENPKDADDTLKVWAMMAGNCHSKILDGPAWYFETEYGLDLEDVEVISKLHERIAEAEEEYKESLSEEADEAREEMKKKKPRRKNS